MQSPADSKRLRANPLAKAWALVTKEPVLAILLVALIPLPVLYPKPGKALPALHDLQPLLALAGLRTVRSVAGTGSWYT